MLWRVGDGTKINIYADKWLHGVGSAKIISPQVDMAKEWTIAKLIDPNLGDQNDCIIDSLFLQFEAQRIKGIPFMLVIARGLYYLANMQIGYILSEVELSIVM